MRKVPSVHALHQMTHVLLAERVPAHGQALVLGAGGGVEMRALVEASPTWCLVGVDPSSEMLALARQTLGDISLHGEFTKAISTMHLMRCSMARRACCRCTFYHRTSGCIRFAS